MSRHAATPTQVARPWRATFLALFLASLTGFLVEVQEWASCAGDCAASPEVTR